MRNSIALKIILSVSGLIAAGVGGAILFMPVAFYSTYGIELGGNISLLSEVRAHGGALLASGLFIMSGVVFVRLAFTSAVVSVLLYLPYGLSRTLSIAIDGLPAEGLVQAAILEMAIGLVCVFTLARIRKDRPRCGRAANSQGHPVSAGDAARL